MTVAITLGQKLKNKFRLRFYRWLDRRQPESVEVQLRQHLLFVFPTSYGAWFLLLIVLLYVFGSNYQNNLILLCAYLLLSLFCCCILAAFFNLYRLQIKTLSANSMFSYAGESLLLTLQLSHTEHKKMLRFSSEDFEPIVLEILPDLLQLKLYPQQRGVYSLQRFTLQSCYPFGLIRCWTHIQLKQACWFYPMPAGLKDTSFNASEQTPDQPDQLAPYQPGNAASSIDWKRLAKNPWQPVVRQNSASAAPDLPAHLVVNTTGVVLEQQLSEFCTLLLQFEREGRQYSLKTPAGLIGPGQGQAHLHRCLQALALC